MSGRGEVQKVGFMVIGSQKAGTTALFDYLRDDPRLNLSRDKEIHFFDDESQDWSSPDYAAYHARFDLTRPGLMGEATPIYVFWPKSMERLATYNPDARLILMLRDPVMRAYSGWQMEYARGVETLPFAQAIREGRARLAGKPSNHPDRRELSHVERGYYGAQVQRVLNLFPRSQLLVQRAEDLRAAPTAVIGQVCSFLGLAPPPGPVAHRNVHAAAAFDYGPGLSTDDESYLRDLYAEDQALLKILTGVTFYHCTSRSICAFGA